MGKLDLPRLPVAATHGGILAPSSLSEKSSGHRYLRIILGFHSENPCESALIRVLKTLRATSPTAS